MGAPVFGFGGAGSGSAFAPLSEGHCNLRLDADDEAANASPGSLRPRGRDARPPGSVLVVAALSAASGAVMGMVFAGYITMAGVLAASLVVGIAIGLWIARLGV